MSIKSNLDSADIIRAFATPIALVSLAGLTIILRIYTRIVLVAKVGLNDCIICLALLLSVTLTTFDALVVEKSLKTPSGELGPDDLSYLYKVLWLGYLCYVPVLYSVKFSILLQYFHVFSRSFQYTRKSCWLLFAFMAGSSISSFFATLFMCHPISFAWSDTESGTCINYKGAFNSIAALNLLSDVGLIIIPLPALRTLQLPIKQKLSIYFLLLLGTFGSIASVLRIYYLSVAATADYNDVLRTEIDPAIWSSIEVNVGIICACLATLKPLFTAGYTRLQKQRALRNDRQVPNGAFAPSDDVLPSFLGESTFVDSSVTDGSSLGKSTLDGKVQLEDGTLILKALDDFTLNDDLYHKFLKNGE